jgi:hypothetical protein
MGRNGAENAEKEQENLTLNNYYNGKHIEKYLLSLGLDRSE